MKYFSIAVRATLLITTPALIANPNADISVFGMQNNIQIPDSRNLSYDEAMELLALIDSDSFEERCSIDELDQVNQLISLFALEGATQDERTDVEIAVSSLFRKDCFEYAYALDANFGYTAEPAIFRGEMPDAVFCKSWFKKQWDQTRKFVREHKKEIIIGVIVVVAVTVVVVTAVVLSSSAAGAAVGAVAASASAASSGSDQGYSNDSGRYSEPEPITPYSEESPGALLQEQFSTFKETIAQEHLAVPFDPNGISIEESGRIIGSLFTHKTIDNLTAQASANPSFAHQLRNFEFPSHYPIPQWADSSCPRSSADLAFSTNYSSTSVGGSSDLNHLSYEARGDWALSSGCYGEALQDFGRAIEIEPNNSTPYLGRGIAHFELGHYEESVVDYHQYVAQTKQPFSVTDFSIGFSKGLPQGVCDSGEGLMLFLTDLVRHPIQTSEQLYDSISTLSSLAKSGEWNVIGEALSPELHQLISQWDELPAKEKGELAGYAFGKHGADILIPGVAAKAVAKGSVAARELGAVCKNLQSAEKLLILEAIADGGAAGMNVGEAIVSAQRTLTAGEELGFTTKEMAALKQSGELERVVGKGRDFFGGNPEMQASYDLFKSAQEKLEPNRKVFLPEQKIRELIHQTGIQTFDRPVGLPENFNVKLSKKGAGMEYVDPQNRQISVRVMPGVPHSPNPAQQKPYVVHLVEQMAMDKHGNLISPKAPEAHIPLDEFVYRK